ncbi:DUF4397 domain-containing protein [Mucilaginibacter limnophilus]|uniref:DUF4397 domain-containing protein n=1 Tax=Mucilaginibacter limnophilus TaxID=1932778 RepID=A0A3S2V786_9SPHI|nr:DUF4397 domain-containing protein [Mucilaginibacter limnophilus]RVU00206.1 DUF4397 domain-containing protein [Mucilaginibacter limnophilus]
MNLKAPFVVFFLIMATLVACQKDDLPPQVSTNTAQLSVINLTTSQLNFFQNGNRLNRTSTIYALGATDYFEVFAGEQVFQFKRNGSSDVLFNVNLTLDSLGSYSLFAAGLSPDDMILANDDNITIDTGDVSMIRFVNASPEQGNFDLLLNDTLAFGSRAYKTISDFVPVRSGERILKITRSGTGDTLIRDTIELTRGRAYTIFSKGLIGQTGDAGFGSGLILN